MPDTASLDLGGSPAAVYLTGALLALAREEWKQEKKSKRLVEAGHATWNRFRGRMGVVDFVDLLLEDAAVNHPEPFDAAAVLGIAHPSESVAEEALAAYVASFADKSREISERDGQQPSERDYLDAQAALLGLTARPAFSDLPKLEGNHSVLELPGTGGRLAAHLIQSRPGVSFRFTIACASWQERMFAGIAAVALGVTGRLQIAIDPDLAKARASNAAFSHVIGLRPDKGGAFDEHQLRGFFADPKTTEIRLV